MPLIYRVHEHPSKEKLFSFSDYLRTINMSFAKGQVVKPGVFNRILANAKGGPHEQVMNDVVLRTQAQAIYHPDNVGHFGLNLSHYAHFTSPIRRYADLDRASLTDPRPETRRRRVERQGNGTS